MDDSTCKDTTARSSNPAILNYYRQFLIKGLDRPYFYILNSKIFYSWQDKVFWIPNFGMTLVRILSSNLKLTKHLIIKDWRKRFTELYQAPGSTWNPWCRDSTVECDSEVGPKYQWEDLIQSYMSCGPSLTPAVTLVWTPNHQYQWKNYWSR